MPTAARIAALGILLSSLIPMGTAQAVSPRETRTRPRLGLALSGGGALGLAHIGVIQYFEEHHIPIDVVAGTSMGGVVGGLYASGLDSGELKKLVENADWDRLLSPTTPYGDQPVVEKQAWNRSPGDLTLRFGRRFSLPAGLNSGEALALLLSRQTGGYGDLASFDDLPTPFRCVATDLVGGDKVVLSSGSLPKALRSTMALPGIFTPVKWGDKVLVDGGLIENIPVAVVRDMGADATIAVAFESAPVDPKQFQSMLGILRQAAAIAVVQNENRSLQSADMVIRVDTTRFHNTDYTASKELIRAGYRAAQARAAELAPFEVSPEEWAAYIRARQQKRERTPQRGRVAEIQAPDPSFRQNAKTELARRLGEGEVPRQKLEETLTGLVGVTSTPAASYRAAEAGGGYQVEFQQRSGASILVRPSFGFAISPGEPSGAALQLSTTIIPADTYKTRLLGSVRLGYDPGFREEYYHPFDGTNYFVAPGIFVERYTVYAYAGDTRNSATRDRYGASFHVGIGTWRFAQLRAGVQAGYDADSKSITVDGVPANSHGFANPELTWTYDTQDSGGFPDHGTRIAGSAGYSFRNTSYPYLQNDFSVFHPVASTVSVFGMGNVATSLGTKLNFYEQFTAGGFGQLSAFRYQEFHANTTVGAGGGVVIRAPELPGLSLYPRLAVWYEAARLDLGGRGWQTAQSASTGAFFPTPLGVAGVAVSFDAAGKARFRLSLGRIGR